MRKWEMEMEMVCETVTKKVGGGAGWRVGGGPRFKARVASEGLPKERPAARVGQSHVGLWGRASPVGGAGPRAMGLQGCWRGPVRADKGDDGARARRSSGTPGLWRRLSNVSLSDVSDQRV